MNKDDRKVKSHACLFCGNRVKKGKNRSKEDVIPIWLTTYLGLTHQSMHSKVYNPVDKKIIAEREYNSPLSFVQGSICKTCNEGWMSDLETNTSSLIKSLYEGKRKIITLDDDEKAKLAKWFYKTALMINSASNFYKMIPDEHYASFYKGQYPDNLILTISEHTPTSTLNHFENSNWRYSNSDIGDSQIGRGVENGYKITLQLGPIILIAAFWPTDGWFYNLIRDVHVPIKTPKNSNFSFYNDPRVFFHMNNSESASLYLGGTIEIYKTIRPWR